MPVEPFACPPALGCSPWPPALLALAYAGFRRRDIG
jgi:membrane protein DedA with SNARE-associated domain